MTHENKHTPAPWRVRTLENFGWNIVYYNNGDKFDIKRISKVNEEANANLIAAAPELLQEMESLAQALEDTGHEPPQSFFDAMNKARGIK